MRFQLALRVGAVLSLSAFALSAASAASASELAGCPKLTAQILSGQSGVTEYSQASPTGGPLLGATLEYPGHFYQLARPLELRLKGNTIAVSSGAIFKFSCYAHTRTSRKLPAVNLLKGSLTITTSEDDPAGVISEEGLFDPRSDATIVFTVKRTLAKRGELTMDDKIHWFANFSDQPTGATTIASRSIVGVTPYVGPRIGTCRYVHAARLATHGGYGKGTATYDD